MRGWLILTGLYTIWHEILLFNIRSRNTVGTVSNGLPSHTFMICRCFSRRVAVAS